MNGRKSAGRGGTRYGHSGVGSGSQDQPERKDEGWQSRQGGRQSQRQGRRGDAAPKTAPDTKPPRGTNTQGDLAGIGEAADEVTEELPKDEAGQPTVPDR